MYGLRNSTLVLRNKNTGQIIGDAISITDSQIEWEKSEVNSSSKMDFSQMKEATLSFDTSHFSSEFLDSITQLYNKIPLYNITAIGNKPIQVQARTNKNKRINKKWLKKYGYRTIYIPCNIELNDCTILEDKDNKCCITAVSQR